MTADHQIVPRPLVLTRAATAGALLLFTLLLTAEIARALGYTDTTPRVMRAAFLLFSALAACAAVIEHFVAATRELRSLNVELERRIAEKSEEIKSTHADIEEARREWALLGERQRILADMHDGLGASLVALLRYVQSGNANQAGIEQRVLEAIQEMRIAVDALQPREGDLATVLGSLRHRLEPLIEPAGVRLEWDVAELPRIEGLEPARVFALQRIVLEAVANALKHSGARRVRLSARAVAGRIEVRVEDDGRGFEPAQPTAGFGLANMRGRAAKIGARMEIDSAPGTGARIILLLPGALPRPSRDAIVAGPDSQALHRLAPPQRGESFPATGRSSPSSAARVTAAAPEWTVSLR